MRNSIIDAIVTNRNVLGFNPDRAVATRNDVLCADAAQHLTPWHAGKHARSWSRALKRRGYSAEAGAVQVRQVQTRLAITGPQRQPVRLMSPWLVMA